jgi:hypothetical protein
MAKRKQTAGGAPLGAPYAATDDTLTATLAPVYDRDHDAAVASQKKAQKEADAASARVKHERANRDKCHEFERAARESQTMNPTMVTTAPPNLTHQPKKPAVTNGEPVTVALDLTPGVNSYGGTGWVTVLEDETTNKKSYSVAYDENSGSRTERNVALWRLTVRDLGPVFLPTPKPKRACTERVPLAPADLQPAKPNCLLDELAHGWKRGWKDGWRARDLKVNHLDRTSEEFKLVVLADLQYLRGHLAGKPKNVHTHRSGQSGKFEKDTNRKKKGRASHPLTVQYLCEAWDIGKNQPTKWEKAFRDGALAKKKATFRKLLEGPDSVLAQARYDMKALYIADHVVKQRTKYRTSGFGGCVPPEMLAGWKADANVAWARTATDDTKDDWAAESRNRLERLPGVQGAILASLKENPSRTLRQLESLVDKIVSASTIGRWLRSRGTCVYTERFLPLLTARQKEKHVAFAEHLRNYWGHQQQKFLLIHYDEKWFYGMLARSNCKHCPDLGLDKQHRKAQHKQAMNKVMAVTFVGYAFDGCFENGGHGVKLGIYRAQKAKIAAKVQRAATRDRNGNVKYNGDTIRKKGDPYMVDCNVTGSSTGTASDPKFALKDLFQETIFPTVAELVGTGGKYEGYLPVFQGDNAGPHVDRVFDSFVKGECGRQGWMWEPQAPQMPHMNVLDLAVFPSMSKRHSTRLANRGGGVAPADEIWKACLNEFKAIDSATIAKAFVMAYRIAGKVIEHKGGNEFLRTDETHLGCRRDFIDTEFGIQPVVK